MASNKRQRVTDDQTAVEEATSALGAGSMSLLEAEAERFQDALHQVRFTTASTAPPTFLSQTEIDSGADSCAASHYHDTMRVHGAPSELHVLPLAKQRCASISDLGDPAGG